MSKQANTSAGPVPSEGEQNFDVSIVIPLLNEEENVKPLYDEIKEVIDADSRSYQIIFVSDGSTDQTVPILQEEAKNDPRVVIIELGRKFGQTAAMAAGFDHSIGKVIVPMDGDLQNDPHDIPKLIDHLNSPPMYDIVSGWRKNRQDTFLVRKLPSVIANRMIRKMTWTSEIHDFGCSMKAYRREVLQDISIYGEMHRFLPAICKWRGARVSELVVNHRPRVAGESKYGLKRTVKVMLDLITVKFLGDYGTKPLYFFGKIAMFMAVLSMVCFAWAVALKYSLFGGDPIMLNRTPLPNFSGMFALGAMQTIMLGVMSELLVRIYHESQDRKPYRIRSIHNPASDSKEKQHA